MSAMDQYAQGVGDAATAGAVQGATQYTQEQASGMCNCVLVDKPYIKSVPGILKPVQIGLSLITFICVSAGNQQACQHGASFGWSQFATMAAFWSTIAVYVFVILKCQERCCACTWFNWPFIEFIYLIFMIAMLLITAIVLSTHNCLMAPFQAAAVFAYFTTFAFAASQFFVARTWWESRQAPHAPTVATTAAPGGKFDRPASLDAEIGGTKY